MCWQTFYFAALKTAKLKGHTWILSIKINGWKGIYTIALLTYEHFYIYGYLRVFHFFWWRGSTKHDLNSLKTHSLKTRNLFGFSPICLPKPVLSICIMLSNTLAANNTINTKGYLGVMDFFFCPQNTKLILTGIWSFSL